MPRRRVSSARWVCSRAAPPFASGVWLWGHGGTVVCAAPHQERPMSWQGLADACSEVARLTLELDKLRADNGGSSADLPATQVTQLHARDAVAHTPCR